MHKSLILFVSWIIATPTLLVSLLIGSYIFNYRIKTVDLDTVFTDTAYYPVNAAPHQQSASVKGISTDVKVADARPIILAEFLKKHQSPLRPYDYWGEFLTDLADKYQLDYRLLPSISMQESNLCKKIPEGSFNCLGLGIHSRGTWHFKRFEDNFDAAAKILKQNYIDKGYVTPDEIQDKYTPGSNGSWEFAVNHFMETLEYADF